MNSPSSFLKTAVTVLELDDKFTIDELLTITDLYSLLAFAIVFLYRKRKVTSRFEPDCSFDLLDMVPFSKRKRFAFVTVMILLSTSLTIVAILPLTNDSLRF